MIFDRRQATRLLLSLGAASGLAGRGWATETTDGLTRAHGHTLVGDLKYPPGFAHYDYVKTDAPKGGTARLASIGAFDSFNPFIVKGNAAGGFNIFGGLIYDTIMTPPLDQSSTEYGLIAEWMEWPSDFSHVDFKFREEAAWHDGRPITVADALNTLNLLRDKGRPFYRLYYKNVSAAKDMGGGVLRFEFDEKNNRELPQIMGQLPVLPSHYWESRNFDESSLEIPLGSGPYRIGRFEANRFTEYERVPDYWGADLPVNIGTSNFDILRLEYFKDGNAGFEAFKAGNVDYRNENSSLLWATAYDFPALERGDVVKEELELNDPKQVQGLGFNLRRPQFADRRTRKAIGLAFDFEWTNTAIYYGQYARPASYFQGTPDLMPEGIPEGAELAFLEPFRDQLPPELFTEPFAYPVSDGSGRPDRRRLREAKKLLEEAGWQVNNGKLVDADGKPFELEFLIAQKVSERVIAPFVKNLERLGIDARIRLIDAAQYVRRLDEFDFDMVTNGVANSPSPGNEQREFWGSEAADQPGSRNTNGVKNPAIDALIDKIIYAKDRDELAAASRAMDRILLWENYNILSVYAPFERIAYWKERVARPEKVPDISIGFPTTWYAPGGGK